jgi:hypothetical protein
MYFSRTEVNLQCTLFSFCTETDSFVNYPSWEKLRLLELRYTSGPSIQSSPIQVKLSFLPLDFSKLGAQVPCFVSFKYHRDREM